MKLTKLLYILTLIFGYLFVVLALVVPNLLTSYDLSDQTIAVIGAFCILICFLFIAFAVLFLIFFFSNRGKEIIKGFRTVNKSNDTLFLCIDAHNNTWLRGDGFYIRQLKVIDYYYGENGPVDKELVDTKQINRLYARMEILNCRVGFDELFSNLMPLAVAVLFGIVNLFVSNFLADSWLVSGIVMLIFIHSKYAPFSLNKSSLYHMDEIAKYEVQRLQAKIDMLVSSFEVDDIAISGLELKRIAINALNKKRKQADKKVKEEIDKVVSKIDRQDLSFVMAGSVHRVKLLVDGEYCYIYSNTDVSASDDWMDDLDPVNIGYACIFNVLMQYDLITPESLCME